MAYNGNTVPLEEVMWTVTEHPLVSEMSFTQAAQYALEYIRLMKAPVILKKQTAKINICDYKGPLPNNIMNIRGVRYLIDPESPQENSIAMTEATDIYHESYNIDGEPRDVEPEQYNQYFNQGEFQVQLNDNYSSHSHSRKDYTYSVNTGIITTSIEEGIIQIAYDTIATSQDGFPLIPDDETFIFGLRYFIWYRYLEPLYDIGKVTDKAFNRIEQNYLFYLPAAQNKFKMPNIDGMETLMNSINRLVLNNQAHDKFFRKTGQKERIRRFY